MPVLNAQQSDLPGAGCPMAHCDPRMSDNVRLVPPRDPAASIIAHDPIPGGSGKGLGCSSNGTIAVCSYASLAGDNVVAYGPNGTRLWTSGQRLGPTAYTSAPIVFQNGSVIAADQNNVIRFDPQGQVAWSKPMPGGAPISPVLTKSGAVILATVGGPISAYTAGTGDFIGSTVINGDADPTQVYDTVNTPCVVGNRIYVSAQLRDGDVGRLVALDFNPADATQPFRIAWSFYFGGPSGASPTCIGDTVYFDGFSRIPGRPKNPFIFAVRDEGTKGTLVWRKPVVNPVPASFAWDPRGGFWVIGTGFEKIQLHSIKTGEVVDSFSVTDLLDDGISYLPASALSIAGTAEQPVMIFGAVDRLNIKSWVFAVDLQSRTVLWKVNLCPNFGLEKTAGQFPIVHDGEGNPTVVFTGWSSGAFFVAKPAATR